MEQKSVFFCLSFLWSFTTIVSAGYGGAYGSGSGGGYGSGALAQTQPAILPSSGGYGGSYGNGGYGAAIDGGGLPAGGVGSSGTGGLGEQVASPPFCRCLSNQPVCGSDGISYASICDLVNSMTGNPTLGFRCGTPCPCSFSYTEYQALQKRTFRGSFVSCLSNGTTVESPLSLQTALIFDQKVGIRNDADCAAGQNGPWRCPSYALDFPPHVAHSPSASRSPMPLPGGGSVTAESESAAGEATRPRSAEGEGLVASPETAGAAEGETKPAGEAGESPSAPVGELPARTGDAEVAAEGHAPATAEGKAPSEGSPPVGEAEAPAEGRPPAASPVAEERPVEAKAAGKGENPSAGTEPATEAAPAGEGAPVVEGGAVAVQTPARAEGAVAEAAPAGGEPGSPPASEGASAGEAIGTKPAENTAEVRPAAEHSSTAADVPVEGEPKAAPPGEVPKPAGESAAVNATEENAPFSLAAEGEAKAEKKAFTIRRVTRPRTVTKRSSQRTVGKGGKGRSNGPTRGNTPRVAVRQTTRGRSNSRPTTRSSNPLKQTANRAG